MLSQCTVFPPIGLTATGSQKVNVFKDKPNLKKNCSWLLLWESLSWKVTAANVPDLPVNERMSQVWWRPPIIPTLKRLRQEEHRLFKVNLGYVATACLKKKNQPLPRSKEMAQLVRMLVV